MSIQAKLALRLEGIVGQYEERVKQFIWYVEAHPQADLGELEEEVERLSRGCFAPVLAAAVRVRGETVVEPQGCSCGGKLQYKGEQYRRLETSVGGIKWGRAYYYCPTCRQGYYPLDKEMGLGPGQFSEGIQEKLSRLAARLPFAAAAAELLQLTGISISARQVARLSEGRGLVLEERGARTRRELLGGGGGVVAAAVRQEPGVWAVSLDAAKARFDSGWHEVKAGVVFWAGCQVGEDGLSRARAEEQSYVAQVGSLEEAGERLYAEVVRRGIDAAKELIVCLGDGAPGNWSQFELHFPNRVEILDWWHALEHLWAVGNGVFGEGTAQAKEWVEGRKGELWHGRVEAVLAALQQAAEGRQGEAAAKEIHYFQTNKERMRYDQFRALGYPIGSGTAESACKRLIAARLKQSGMCWGKQGAQAVLNLRSALLSDCWEEAWQDSRPLPKAA